MFGVSQVELGLVDIGVTGVLGSLWFSDAGSRLDIPSSVSESSFREGIVDADDKVAFDEISNDSIPESIDVVAGDPPHMDSHIGRNTARQLDHGHFSCHCQVTVCICSL